MDDSLVSVSVFSSDNNGQARGILLRIVEEKGLHLSPEGRQQRLGSSTLQVTQTSDT